MKHIKRDYSLKAWSNPLGLGCFRILSCSYQMKGNETYNIKAMGPVVQWKASLTADPGVTSSIQARSHTFVAIDHEIISMAILLLLIQEGLLSVTSESMCTKYWLIA